MKKNTSFADTGVDDRCGTYAGYIAHSKRKDTYCEPCLIARHAYAKIHAVIYKENIRKTKRAWFDKNRQKMKDYQKGWRDENLGKVKLSAAESRIKHKENYLIYQRKWYKNNPEKMKAKGRKYRAANPEKISANAKKWAKNNPEKMRESARKIGHIRRAQKLSVPFDSYTTVEILDLYGSDCHLCGLPIDLEANRHVGYEGWGKGLHLDHVIPLSLGGNDTISNVKPAHGKCNLTKRRK